MTIDLPDILTADDTPDGPALPFRFIVEALNEGILLCDLAGRLLYVNRRMAQMLEYSVDAMLGESLFSFMTEEWAERAEDNLHRRAQGISEVFEHEFRTQSGETLHTLVSTQPIKGSGEEIEASLVAITDITERVHAIEESKRLQARTMALDRLVVAGTLAAGVGHEINNPLAFLTGHLDLVHLGVDDCLAMLDGLGGPDDADFEESREDIADILQDIQHSLRASTRGAHRIRDIIDNLRMFTRDETSPPYPIDVHEILETSIRMAAHQLPVGTRMVRDYGQAPEVLGHESSLGQVLLNLLVNAAHAIDAAERDESILRVVLDHRDEWVTIDIEDSGVGIAPENLERIFDLFFTTKAPDEGTGLGLSICKQLIERMGGEIDVESELGKGTRIRLRLQAAPA